MPVPIPLTLNSPCAVVHLLITRVTDVLRKRDTYEVVGASVSFAFTARHGITDIQGITLVGIIVVQASLVKSKHHHPYSLMQARTKGTQVISFRIALQDTVGMNN